MNGLVFGSVSLANGPVNAKVTLCHFRSSPVMTALPTVGVTIGVGTTTGAAIGDFVVGERVRSGNGSSVSGFGTNVGGSSVGFTVGDEVGVDGSRVSIEDGSTDATNAVGLVVGFKGNGTIVGVIDGFMVGSSVSRLTGATKSVGINVGSIMLGAFVGIMIGSSVSRLTGATKSVGINVGSIILSVGAMVGIASGTSVYDGTTEIVGSTVGSIVPKDGIGVRRVGERAGARVGRFVDMPSDNTRSICV